MSRASVSAEGVEWCFGFGGSSVGGRGTFLRGLSGVNGLARIIYLDLFLAKISIRKMSTRAKFPVSRSIRRAGAIAKRIISRANRPIVNTDIIIRKAAGNAVASFSKEFTLRIPSNGGIIVSFIKCIPRAVTPGRKGSFEIILGRSSGVLSRIIMINCNARGTGSIAKSVKIVAPSRVSSLPISGLNTTLTKRVPNLDVDNNSDHPNRKTAVSVHRSFSCSGSNNDAGPVIVVSSIVRVSTGDNLPALRAFGTLSPSRVRDVSILHSTDTTVCNSHTSRNTVVMGAGQNGSKTPGVGCSNGFKFGSTIKRPGALGKTTCKHFTGSFGLTGGGVDVSPSKG